MQLTRAADYAVRVMVHLAGLPAESRVNRSQLAAAAECPNQFMSKVLQSLIRARLVISHRGNVGGFELSAAARKATLLDVIEAIEGPIRINLCLISDNACHRTPTCPAHPVWCEAQESLTRVLGGVTIAQLAEHARAIVATDETKWN
jgi:Rrf2 family protein